MVYFLFFVFLNCIIVFFFVIKLCVHVFTIPIVNCLKNVLYLTMDNDVTAYRMAKRAVVVVNIWWLDLQLPMHSVPITTNVVSSNPAHAKCTRYNAM